MNPITSSELERFVEEGLVYVERHGILLSEVLQELARLHVETPELFEGGRLGRLQKMTTRLLQGCLAWEENGNGL